MAWGQVSLGWMLPLNGLAMPFQYGPGKLEVEVEVPKPEVEAEVLKMTTKNDPLNDLGKLPYMTFEK